MNLSIIIPLFNEQSSLEELCAELRQTASTNGYTIEIILVDDGSVDESWQTICRLAEKELRVFGVRLRRNFGKAAAISAGTVLARYDLVVTMDADLQDVPSEIPRLLAEMEKGFDVVSGWKRNRQDAWTRRFASRVFNGLVNALTKVRLHDHNCGFKLYRRQVFDEIDLYGGFHRFVPVLAAARGFRIGETEVHHRNRKYGKSKYGSLRIVKGLLDLMTVCFLTGYSQRPQHLMGSAGLISFFTGVTGLFYMAVYWVLRMNFYPDWTPLHQRPVVIYSVAALLLGTQLLTMGFLAELIVARDQKRGRRFAVQETVGAQERQEDSARIFSSELASNELANTIRQTQSPE